MVVVRVQQLISVKKTRNGAIGSLLGILSRCEPKLMEASLNRLMFSLSN